MDINKPGGQMNKWVCFFLGSPKRVMWTLAAMLIVLAGLAPSLAINFINNIFQVFGPILEMIAIVVVLWLIVRSAFKGSNKK